jgi:diguanylate cyclase (GGDEF)-like protein
MPQTDCKVAQDTAHRLRELVAQTPLSERDLRITISMGLACWNGKQELAFDTLLARADRALYQSKMEGRNRLSVWEMLTQPPGSLSSK